MDIPVLIIGAGPAGSTLALQLSKLGIQVVAVSKHASTANTPRAHILNQRAMEVMRDVGIEGEVKRVGVGAECAWNLFLFFLSISFYFGLCEGCVFLRGMFL